MTGSATEELYPMRTIASLTGVNPVTLRAWERRYGLVTPRRAPSGHRLYTREDLNLLRYVVSLRESGVSIRRAAKLVARDDAAGREVVVSDEAAPQQRDLAARLLEAVEALDEQRLASLYEEALGRYPADVLNESVLTPILHELGERWSRRAGGIAEEHFFASFLRDRLGAAMHHRYRSGPGPRLLAACMPGERHDLGLLMFNQGAVRRGYRVTMLGAAVPLRELVAAARAASPRAVVLAITGEPATGILDAGVREVVDALSVPVLVGGAASIRHREALETAGATVLGNRIGPALVWLDEHLGHGARASA